MKLGKMAAVGAAFLTLGLGGTVAHADTTTDAAADYASAIKSMPQGLPVNAYFETGTIGSSNSAKVTDPASDGTQAVWLTNNVRQLGNIWAKKDNYYFDLTKPQKASMWLYLGNQGSNAGDGMAFVLQNDNRGVSATATDLSGNPAVGETLGVWGMPPLDSSETGATTATAGRAIQNSWALEFDTYFNAQTPLADNYTSATSFDYGDAAITGPHIAASNPGNVGAYHTVVAPNTNGKRAMLLWHNGTIDGKGSSSFLSNGAWHHLSLTYQPPSVTGTTSMGMMTYTFDDKNPTTGESRDGESNQFKVDLSMVDPNNTGQARWGFTGSTGSSYENNLVVFEQIPGLVGSSATSTITDSSEDGVTIPSGAAVAGGERLKLSYTLSYDSGRADWTNVKAQIPIPNNLTATSGTVTYADGSTEKVDLSGLSGSKLTYTLKKSLSSSLKTATIDLNATADNTSTAVAPTEAKFVGDNALASTTTIPFNISQLSSSMTLALTSASTMTLNTGEDATITGKATVAGGTLSDKTLKLRPNLNGKDLDATTYTASGSQAPYTGTFSYKVAASDLQTGLNTLTLYSTDSLGDTSEDVTVLINVGSLAFGTVSSEASFSGQLSGSGQDIYRTGDWQLNVNDSRGSGSGWTLQAETTDFVSTSVASQKLNGYLEYGTATGDVALNGSPSTVVSRTNSGTSNTTDVAGSWGNTTGPVVHVNSDAVQGNYQATITWTLLNTIS